MVYGKHPRTAFILGFLLAGPAMAQDVHGANVAGRGGALVGDPADNANLLSNPGALALSERYDVQGYAGFGPDGALEWGVSALDARTSPVALGLSWRRTIRERELRTEDLPGWIVPGDDIERVERAHELAVGVAYPFADRTLSLGIGGLLRTGVDDRAGPFLTGDLSLGFGWRVSDEWTLGLSARNLLPLPDQEELPLHFLVGAHFEVPTLITLALDAGIQTEEIEGTPLLVRGGLELHTGSVRPRLGYRYEGPRAQHQLTAGFGLETEAGAIEYALALPLGQPFEAAGLVHTVGIRARF